jgi:hypothetical protein
MTEKKFNLWEFVKTNSGSIFLTIYIIFSVLFFLNYIYNGVIRTIASNSYNQAILDVAQWVAGAKCQPVPLNVGQGQQIGLLDASCVQQQKQEEAKK